MRAVLVGLVSLAGAPTALAADEASQAEVQRLSEQVRSLAGRNAWAGVSRTYAEAAALGELPCDLHAIGASGAKQVGDMWAAYQRYEAALACDPDGGHDAQLDAIDRAFGRVKISFQAKKHPPLEPVQMPFDPDQRKVVLLAQEQSEDSKVYEGMLPAGEYRVGGLTFEAQPGPWFAPIEVPKE